MRYSEILKLFEEGRIVKNVNTTCDVQPGEIGRQADKLDLGTNTEGHPIQNVWQSVKRQKKDPRVK